MLKKVHYGGALLSPPDDRDYKISRCMEIPSGGADSVLPRKFECWVPDRTLDQKQTAKCTSYAMALIFSCIWHKLTGEDRDFSTAFIYANPLDSTWRYPGAFMRDVCKTVCNHGDILAVIGENHEEKPDCIAWFEENYEGFRKYAKMLVKSYIRLESAEEARAFMYKYKIPLFVNLEMGDITPFASDKEALHAVAAYKYGYNTGFTCRNSWGEYDCPEITNKKFKIFKEVWGIVPNEKIVFPDVEEQRWSREDIYDAVEKGLIYGYDDGTFKPAQSLSREEFCVLAGRLLRYMDEHYTKIEK